MKTALEDAGVDATDIQYINAHGTSTRLNDKTETMAIKSVLGDHAYKVLISSNKSMVGHLTAASGALEFISTVHSVKNNIVPPTVNYRDKDPECDLNCTPNVAREMEIRGAISNSFGFGGQNGSLVLVKYKG